MICVRADNHYVSNQMDGFESERQRACQQLDWIYLSGLGTELTDGDSALITNKRLQQDHLNF